MATQRKARTVEGETVEIPPNIPLMNFPAIPPGSHAEVEEFDDVSSLNAVLDELGADEVGGFVVVYRETVVNGRKGDDEYIDRYPVGEFSLNGLKSQWGAGKYKVNVYRGGGGGLAARKVIIIAKDPTAAVTPATPSAVTDLTPIIAAIRESSDKTLQAILALAQGAQQKAPSRMEMLNEMQVMRDMFTPAGQAAPMNFNPVEMMKLGMEMAGKGGDGESSNAWATKLIEQFGPMLMPLLENNIARQSTPPRHALPAPTTLPVGHPEAVQADASQSKEENPVSIIVGNYLKLLVKAAEQKAPVEEYADSILNSVPESYVGDIENMLRPDDWQARVRRHAPAVDQHVEWFTALRNTLLAYIDEDKAIASAHLTGIPAAGSVITHENADTATTLDNSGISGSAS